MSGYLRGGRRGRWRWDGNLGGPTARVGDVSARAQSSHALPCQLTLLAGPRRTCRLPSLLLWYQVGQEALQGGKEFVCRRAVGCRASLEGRDTWPPCRPHAADPILSQDKGTQLTALLHSAYTPRQQRRSSAAQLLSSLGPPVPALRWTKLDSSFASGTRQGCTPLTAPSGAVHTHSSCVAVIWEPPRPCPGLQRYVIFPWHLLLLQAAASTR